MPNAGQIYELVELRIRDMLTIIFFLFILHISPLVFTYYFIDCLSIVYNESN